MSEEFEIPPGWSAIYAEHARYVEWATNLILREKCARQGD